MNMKLNAGALISGLIFGLGLAMSGLTDADKVLGFLDVAGQWDPTLMFVLGGAVVTTMILFPVILKNRKPVIDECFHTPARGKIDRTLVTGAALFGIGWGLAGYCPGPALAGLGVLSAEALWFVPAMVAGMLLHRVTERRDG